jgi:hypothetical protein
MLSCTNAVPLYRFQFIDNKAASASIFACKVCMCTAVHMFVCDGNIYKYMLFLQWT